MCEWLGSYAEKGDGGGGCGYDEEMVWERGVIVEILVSRLRGEATAYSLKLKIQGNAR